MSSHTVKPCWQPYIGFHSLNKTALSFGLKFLERFGTPILAGKVGSKITTEAMSHALLDAHV